MPEKSLIISLSGCRMVINGMVGAILRYRGFITSSVKREFQSKYRNSMLGAAWNILNPLAMIFVYTVIFAQVMKARLPGTDSTFAYSIYLCSGVLTWGLFSEITGRGQSMFLDYANLIKKINFPRICLPVILVLNALLNFAIVFGLFTAFLAVSGNFPGIVYIGIVPVLVIQILFSIGLAMILGVLNVFFRDVGQFFGIALQFWFWLTPIVYPSTILPESIRSLVGWNPMTPIIMSYQTILVNGQWPQWHTLWPVTALGIVLCVLGLNLFRKRSGEMVDEL
jgi:lipopolysaccharide transport system permease protein